MTDDQNIDRLFKAAIDGHEEDPSSESWNVIDKKLDGSNIISIQKKYADLKKLVAVLILLLMGAIAYEWHSAYSHKAIIVSTNTSNKTGQRATQEVVSSNTTLVNRNSVAANNENTTTPVANIPGSFTEQLNLTNIENGTKSIINEKHVPIRIHTKAKFSSSTTNGEVSELNDTDEKIILSNNTSDLNSDHLLKMLPIQHVEHSIEESAATGSVSLRKNIMPNTNDIIVINDKGSLHKLSHFSLIPFYSPSLTTDLLDDDDDNNRRNNGQDAEHIKKGEHQSSYSFGASIEYSINNHWSIGSGLTFIQKVSHINPKTVYAEDAGNGNVGYLFDFSSGYSYLSERSANLSVGDSAQTSRTVNVLQYLSVPLQAKYTITKGKFNFNATLGASYNILLKGTLETEVANDSIIEDETVNKIAGLKPGYISGLIGFGAEYPLTKKIAVCFNPSFDMAFTSITKDASVRSYPSFFAFAAGLHIKL